MGQLVCLKTLTRNDKMKKRIVFQPILVALFISATTVGCFEPPSYSNTPEIVFNNITKFTVKDSFSKRDSVIISLDYKDGDGDLGEGVNGRNSPRYSDWGNYELRLFRLETATKQFVEFPQPENKTIFFPILKTDLKRGPIEGKLDYSPSYPYNNRSKMTVIKYQVRIRDRNLNVSNMVESDTISVPL